MQKKHDCLAPGFTGQARCHQCFPKQWEWQFSLDWIVPYVRTTQRQKWVDKNYKRYSDWKRYVRLIANTQGVPDQLSAGKRYSVSLWIHWKGKARADLDNCLKGILDALWSQDRRVFHLRGDVDENSGRDALNVTVSGE